jgi:hypothetical protein
MTFVLTEDDRKAIIRGIAYCASQIDREKAKEQFCELEIIQKWNNEIGRLLTALQNGII